MEHPWNIPPLGTPKSQIPTPALVVDVDTMEANLARMAGYFVNQAAKLRPHFKTHKSPLLAQKQMQAGAIGITCAKLGEAEVLVEAGIPSILIANQIVDPLKLRRLAQLARKTQIIVAVDQAENIPQISQAAVQEGSTIHLLVEVDVGMHRCGVPTAEAALALAKLAVQQPGLHFSGVMGYEGHTVFEADAAQRKRNAEQAMTMLVGAAELIRRNGLPVEIVSAGSTPTFNQTGAFPGVTEIQAGSYIFMDTKYGAMGLPFRCALSVLATVISVPAPDRAILDAGMKVLTTDNGMPELVGPEGVRLVRFSEEHGRLEVDPQQACLHVGDRLEIIPSHVCTTVNLHDRYYAVRGGRLEAVWPIAGRGKSQ